LRHSFSWLASLLGCTVHTLVAISPWSCYVFPHEPSPLFSSTIFWVWPYSRERERERERVICCTFGIPLYFRKKFVW
jgi:hypothetical protein